MLPPRRAIRGRVRSRAERRFDGEQPGRQDRPGHGRDERHRAGHGPGAGPEGRQGPHRRPRPGPGPGHGRRDPGRHGGSGAGRPARRPVLPGGGAPAGPGGPRADAAPRPAREQRRGHLRRAGGLRRRPGDDLRAQPPGLLPPDPRAAPPPRAGSPVADRQRGLGGPRAGPDRLRRPAGRAGLLDVEGLPAVQARQRPLHPGAGPAPGQPRRDRQRPPSGRHRLRFRAERARPLQLAGGPRGATALLAGEGGADDPPRRHVARAAGRDRPVLLRLPGEGAGAGRTGR